MVAGTTGVGPHVFVINEFFIWICNCNCNQAYDYHKRECVRRRMVYWNKNRIDSFVLNSYGSIQVAEVSV